MSVVGLERALLRYTSDPSLADKPFDLKTVPVDTAPMKDLPKQSEPPTPPQSVGGVFIGLYNMMHF